MKKLAKLVLFWSGPCLVLAAVPADCAPQVANQARKTATRSTNASAAATLTPGARSAAVKAAVAADVRGDIKTAVSLWRSLADQGHTYAQFRLGQLYLGADGGDRNPALEKRYEDMAGANGVGTEYEWQELPDRAQSDWAEVAKFLAEAADQHNDRAEATLAFLNFRGAGMPEDMVQWRALLARAAEHGNTGAAHRLATWDDVNNEGTQATLNELRRSAELGNSYAAHSVAGYYSRPSLNGNVVSRDACEAEYWYVRAVKQADPETIGSLSLMMGSLIDFYLEMERELRTGLGSETPPLPKNATAAAASARHAMNLDPTAETVQAIVAVTVVAEMYERGDGVAKDLVEAENLYRLAANLMLRRMAAGSRVHAFLMARLLKTGVRGIPANVQLGTRLQNASDAWSDDTAWKAVATDVRKWFADLRIVSTQRAVPAAPSATLQPILCGSGGLLTRSQPDVRLSSPISADGSAAGTYSPLPPLTNCRPVGGTSSRHRIKNATPYRLNLVINGTSDRDLSINPGEEHTIEVPPGSYKITGRVDAAGVLPFYGESVYRAGQECSSEFLLRTQQR